MPRAVEEALAGFDEEAATLRAALVAGRSEEVATLLIRASAGGFVTEVRELTAALLGHMRGAGGPQWMEPRTVPRLILKLTEAMGVDDEALPAARDVMDAAQAWRTNPEGGRMLLDPGTADRWRWCRELTALPMDFPLDLRLAMARGIGRGTPGVAREQFRTWAGKHAKRVEGVSSQLERHAPRLHEIYADAFDPADDRRAAAVTRRTRAPRATPLSRGRVAAGLEELSRFFPLVIPLTLLGGAAWLGWSLFNDDGPHLDVELESARVTICQYAGQGRPACVLATVVTRGLASGDCPSLERSVPRLAGEIRALLIPGGSEVRTAEDGDILKRTLRDLRERHKATCSQEP